MPKLTLPVDILAAAPLWEGSMLQQETQWLDDFDYTDAVTARMRGLEKCDDRTPNETKLMEACRKWLTEMWGTMENAEG